MMLRPLLALLLWLATGQATAGPELPLFSAASRSPRHDITDAKVSSVSSVATAGAWVRDKQVVRARAVDIDLPLLAQPMADLAKTPRPKQALALDLFDDVHFVADLDGIERTARGAAWIGRLRGVEKSQVVFVVSGDIVMGNIVSPAGRYHIRYSGDGLHEVQAIDSSLFDKDEPFIPAADIFSSDTRGGLPLPDAPLGDDGSFIDVMVVYTATTRAAAGGTAPMQALIDLAVAETNVSYANSGVIQRIRLVHSEEVAYDEAATDPLYAALQCIRDPADGCLDQIHSLRDTYGADLVSFWLENGGGYCGLGYQMESVSVAFAAYSFSAVARSCATGYYSFGHELGHNMGAKHDEYVDKGSLPYSYAHGYAYPAGKWRTVMAYNNACSAQGVNCSRIPYWSNPANSYAGATMGNATADNRQTLNNTAPTVASFRQAAVVGIPVLSNRSPMANLSGSAESELHYRIHVPPGARDLQFSIAGGIGDADLYVRYGSAPTTSLFDCRPYLDGNTESCTFGTPTAGDWYVMVRGYGDFSGVTLLGRYVPNISHLYWLILGE